MGNFERCKTCGDWVWVRSHECAPIWDVWCPEDDETREDATHIHADDEEEAAAKWADMDDAYSGEYRIVGGREVLVCVARPFDEFCTFVVVFGEAVPSYSGHGATASHPRQERTHGRP